MGPRRGWLDQTAAFNPEKHQQWRPGRVLAGRTGQSDENVATCQKTLGQRTSDIGNKVKLQACSATILRLFPLQAKVWGPERRCSQCQAARARGQGGRSSPILELECIWRPAGAARANTAGASERCPRDERAEGLLGVPWRSESKPAPNGSPPGTRRETGATGSRPARQGKTAISLLASQLCQESGQLFRAAGCLGWC
ncbi:hypothetical protein ACCO45_008632 [Purpureocillium lilacinum]|uniref:Uncharacterized protein n=1 Tax=Purpureocillium lilacinum TaxID=33203 RepID=A0ACC4DP36_PURLI